MVAARDGRFRAPAGGWFKRGRKFSVTLPAEPVFSRASSVSMSSSASRSGKKAGG